MRALTRLDTNGDPFTRLPDVESQIRSLLTTDPAEIAARTSLPKTDSAGHLRDETLVYFFREWHRDIAEGDADVQKEYALSSVFEEIERRFFKYLRKSKHRPKDNREFEDWAQNVSGGFIEKLMDLETDRVDFAEVRFISFAAMEALGKVRKTVSEAVKKAALVSLDNEDGDGPPIQPILDELSPEKMAMLREGLMALPRELREVVILLDFEGWQSESGDPRELTVSGYLGVSSKTVRNRHDKAREILMDYIGGER